MALRWRAYDVPFIAVFEKKNVFKFGPPLTKLSVCLSICLCVCVCLSVCLSACLSVYLCVCLSMCLCVCMSVCASVCLYVSMYYVYMYVVFIVIHVCKLLHVRRPTGIEFNDEPRFLTITSKLLMQI